MVRVRVSSDSKRIKAMLPDLGRLRVSPTGGRNPFTVEAVDEGDATRSTTPAALKAVLDAVFGDEALRDNIMPNILHKDFKGTDLERVCEQALQYCAFHPMNAQKCRDNPNAWLRLIVAIFGAEVLLDNSAHRLFPDRFPASSTPYPDYWQTYFFALCKRYEEHRTGARPFDLWAYDWEFRFFQMAAVLHDGNRLTNFGDATPELCMAAVQQNGLALRWVPVRHQTRALVEAALANNEAAMEGIRNPDTAIDIVGDRPELLRYDMPRLNGGAFSHLRRTILQGDGSAFQYLPSRDKTIEYLQIALQSFPWAIDDWPETRFLHAWTLEQAALSQQAFSLRDRTGAQRANRHYVMNVLRHLPLQLQHVTEILKFQDDLELAWVAVEQDLRALEYVYYVVLAEPEFQKRFTDKYERARTWRERIEKAKLEAGRAIDQVNAMDPLTIDMDRVRAANGLDERAKSLQARFDWLNETYPGWIYDWKVHRPNSDDDDDG